jgi:hypothetical protein
MDNIEDTDRRIRSFGCNGPKDRNEYACRYHCRSKGYRTGYCSPLTNHKTCVCLGSPIPKSQFPQLSHASLNRSRL